MLSANENYLKELRENIMSIKEKTDFCEVCGAITDV